MITQQFFKLFCLNLAGNFSALKRQSIQMFVRRLFWQNIFGGSARDCQCLGFVRQAKVIWRSAGLLSKIWGNYSQDNDITCCCCTGGGDNEIRFAHFI